MEAQASAQVNDPACLIPKLQAILVQAGSATARTYEGIQLPYDPLRLGEMYRCCEQRGQLLYHDAYGTTANDPTKRLSRMIPEQQHSLPLCDVEKMTDLGKTIVNTITT